MKISRSNTSLFWPVYRHIEDEVKNLFFSIHCDDNQLQTYSVSIADLITRAAVEIEAISKDLYFRSGGERKFNKARTKELHLKYDEDCLTHLETQWTLSKKAVFVTHEMYFGSVKSLKPFNRNATRNSGHERTYGWNLAYQAIKHDRSESIEKATIENLISIMAALYILNIYRCDQVLTKAPYEGGAEPDLTFGSQLFSCTIHEGTSTDSLGHYRLNSDFEEHVIFSRLRIIDETKIMPHLSKSRKGQYSEELSIAIRGAFTEYVVNKNQYYIYEDIGPSTLDVTTLLSRLIKKYLSENPKSQPLSISERDDLIESITSSGVQFTQKSAPGIDVREQLIYLIDEMNLVSND